MFFNDKSTTGKTTPNEFCLQAANRLLQLVKKVRGVLRWSSKSWANEIRLLCEELDGESRRVELVLCFMESPSTKGLRPTSAKWFRRNFYWIEEKFLKSRPTVQVKVITLEAKKLYKELMSLGWNSKAKPQLQNVIQASLTAVLDFRSKLKTVSKQYQNGELSSQAKRDFGRFANWLVSGHVIVPIVLLRRWFEDVCHQLLNWKDWSGNLDYFIPHPRHKMFTKLGTGWATEYTGKADCWWKLLKGMGYAGEED